MAALAKTAARNKDRLDALAPLAREIAKRAGLNGCTVADLRVYAVQRGLLSDQETNLHFLGAAMKHAGLTRTKDYRRSHVVASHGKLLVVWRDPGPL
jgi:hypothetical protein